MITLRPVDVDRDAALLHAWVTHPRSHFWGMAEASVADVAAEYAALGGPPHEAHLGLVDGEPAFLAERYDPAHSPLAGLPDLAPGDLGMHLLVAPTETPQSGFTRRVFAAVMRWCFEDDAVARVVVEPDVRNEKIRALNAEAGFEVARVVTQTAPLAKDAALSFCTRENFASSPMGDPA